MRQTIVCGETKSGVALGRAKLLVTGCVIGLLGLAAAAPYLAAQGFPECYSVFHSVCHQIGERCFYIGEKPMALCVRCTGIYAGIAVGAWLYAPHKKQRRRWLLGLLAACAVLGIDVSAEAMGLYHNFKAWRFITGLFFGAALSPFLTSALAEQLCRSKSHEASYNGS
ncbi:MAG: DUF2085 domain-containing protein [Chloroherpetonaceae bacterium]|nr:DUF2085 domain-containing protein [Chloroherpetonaceae bacterium]MDW8466551.1 DUF2085 domain-containing protein [Chloroherpetonaceae bacterium]